MNCWRYIKSYGHISSPVEGHTKIFSHVSIQVQGDTIYIYIYMIWTVVYTSVYFHTGVPNYETVRHTSSLLVYGTHTGIWY